MYLPTYNTTDTPARYTGANPADTTYTMTATTATNTKTTPTQALTILQFTLPTVTDAFVLHALPIGFTFR